MKNKLQKFKLRIVGSLNLKSQFTLLLLASITAFSSCKKASITDPIPESNNLLEVLQSGAWNTTFQELETEQDSSGFKVKMIFSEFNTKTTFNADKTCTVIGKSTVKMSVFMNGQLMNEDTQVLDSDNSGTYNVISESKLFMDLDGSGGAIYDVVSYSSSKLALAFDGPMEQDGEMINLKMNIVYEK
jgi:hypothetical protein